MPTAPMEMWAGFECTLNRVGDVQHDQLERSGHYTRESDLDLVASLGVRTIRYPILWERLDGRSDNDARWRWTDERLKRLRALGVDPIIGLMHHGSGPLDTSLIDDAFPARFGAFAARVAKRYPWVTRYTPINEPLTTARFATLYGLWYPHARDDRKFAQAMLNQTRATRLAMEAIRREVPEAQLVQTEDLGYTHSVPELSEQAAFENERRWLSFDLLCGRVDAQHPLWGYLEEADVTTPLLEEAVEGGCMPDLLGVNHYVTSERWLDTALDRYCPHTHGGNGRVRYADVEAVRGAVSRVLGPAKLLEQIWERYRIPIAVTEAHLGCSREQQLRWLHDVWTGAHQARAAGADVRAVTAWAALGTHDWCSLVTCADTNYESGLFDTRSTTPRPTALATMTGALARHRAWEHPVLVGPRWWRKPDADLLAHKRLGVGHEGRPILIAGAGGTLGQAFVRSCEARGLACLPLGRDALDITDEAAVGRTLRESGAWAIINAAGWVRVDAAEWCVDECRRLNVEGAEMLARASSLQGIPLLTFSSDLVFDGLSSAPYLESDVPAPLAVYGTSKAEAETVVQAACRDALVVRTSWFFGPWDRSNFLTTTLASLAAGVAVTLPNDLVISPTFVPHLAEAALDLLIDGERGIWHLVNEGPGASVVDIARQAAVLAGLDPTLINGRPHASLGFAARRPPMSALGSERGSIMPTLDVALAAYVGTRAWLQLEAPGVVASAPAVIHAST